jgi:hypothetical protein
MGSIFMAAKSTHVFPSEDGWIVVRESPGSVVRTKKAATRKAAMDAARQFIRNSAAAQIVVHNRDGSFTRSDVHGLPEVQRVPAKSSLSRKAIEKAVSTVVRERLAKGIKSESEESQ